MALRAAHAMWIGLFGNAAKQSWALNCQTKPLTLKVHDNLPVNIPSEALMAWSGNLKADLIQDTELQRIMMSPDDQTSFLRFTGSGDVVVEQGSLRGDRRSTRRT